MRAAVGENVAENPLLIRLDRLALVERTALKASRTILLRLNAATKDRVALNALGTRLTSEPVKLSAAAKPPEMNFFVCPPTKDKVAVRLFPVLLLNEPEKLRVAAKL